MASKLNLFLYKSEKRNIGLLVWASCLTDAVDRICFYLYKVKGFEAKSIVDEEVRKRTNRLREPAKGEVFEEFKINK